MATATGVFLAWAKPDSLNGTAEESATLRCAKRRVSCAFKDGKGDTSLLTPCGK
ncbi:MAG: hypothetical protein Q7U28_15500 [Aquabacterium sp.]|nr:hypothetical protein [Aquabacterium sp.]